MEQTVLIRTDAEMKQTLRRLAALQGVTTSVVGRWAFTAYIDAHRHLLDGEQPRT